jgi:hypothetical protein
MPISQTRCSVEHLVSEFIVIVKSASGMRCWARLFSSAQNGNPATLPSLDRHPSNGPCRDIQELLDAHIAGSPSSNIDSRRWNPFNTTCYEKIKLETP